MAQTARDDNGYPTALATSSTDGSTPIRLQVNPSTKALLAEDDVTGTDLSDNIATRDENNYPVLMGVSSADGVTPTAIYADPVTGKLLIKST